MTRFPAAAASQDDRDAAELRFLVGAVEDKLREGGYPDLVDLCCELSRLSETSGGRGALAADPETADRFDLVMQAGRELYREPRASNNRCRDCPGAMHTEARCPFRWGA